LVVIIGSYRKHLKDLSSKLRSYWIYNKGYKVLIENKKIEYEIFSKKIYCPKNE